MRLLKENKLWMGIVRRAPKAELSVWSTVMRFASEVETDLGELAVAVDFVAQNVPSTQQRSLGEANAREPITTTQDAPRPRREVLGVSYEVAISSVIDPSIAINASGSCISSTANPAIRQMKIPDRAHLLPLF